MLAYLLLNALHHSAVGQGHTVGGMQACCLFKVWLIISLTGLALSALSTLVDKPYLIS